MTMLSVIIPAYNEGKAIGQVVEKAHDTLNKAGYLDFEIIVVDDGSTDNTGDIARAAGAQVVRQMTNQGYGQSLKVGIKSARHETIVILDADATYPVEDIPKMVTEYNKGYDLVVGKRTGKYFKETTSKSFLRLALRLIVELVAMRPIEDINSGFRVFSKNRCISFFPRLCNTFSFSTSQTLAYIMNNLHVTYLPIDYHKRVGNSKVRIFFDSIATLQFICQAALYYAPLRIFSFLSLLILLLAGVFVILAAVFYLKSAFYLAIGSILVSVLVFALGLLANLLQQIMLNQERTSCVESVDDCPGEKQTPEE